ncbi:uncharacterized protein J3D65DRAFT_632023 [Phyllosticta citribraziliensis]|uniref:Tetratricopeptide repeat protein 36 n=1 Tax=Phyllosticta citribraziliensis TaxID=989973 RepID=A0ABR1LFJ4_9PEZI
MADVNTALSSNDAKVLSAIFDPESSPSTSVTIKSDCQKLPHVPDALLPPLQLTERDAIRSLGTSTRPDKKDIKSAIDSLSLLIERNPQYASAYMNRAQALRLLIDDDGDFFHAKNLETTSALFGDLAKCIRLLSPKSPQDAVSPLQARLLATSHTHRGYLFLKAAKAAGQGSLEAGPDEIKGKDRNELEERASREFYAGGMYGDQMAKQMAVKTNPYARLCGAIVKQALKQDE